MFNRRSKTDGPKKRRIGIHETTHENDIRYRGPLSSRHFKILGWLCIVVMQVAALVRLGGRFDAGFAASSVSWLKVLEGIADFALPFLLIASFAQLLNTEDGYKKQLLVNGAAMAGICALYYLVFYRYIVGSFEAILDPPSDALPTVRIALLFVAPYGFLTFNIFVDLFLCALTMFFLNYNPRHVFPGKSRMLFRLLALLPIAYEVGCMLLKVRSARGLVQIPEWAYPLLTVKPPMTFVLFVALSLFVKTREMRFRRHGKTHEEYQAFLKTRRNSWNFAVFLAIMLVIVSVVDFTVVVGFALDEVVQSAVSTAELSQPEATVGDGQQASTQGMPEGGQTTAEAGQPEVTASPEAQETPGIILHEDQINANINIGMGIAGAVGFGGSISLIFLAPLVLLFSYTRKPKNPMLDLLIPVVGIALIVFVYLEGGRQMLANLPIQRINMQELKDSLSMSTMMLMQ